MDAGQQPGGFFAIRGIFGKVPPSTASSLCMRRSWKAICAARTAPSRPTEIAWRFRRSRARGDELARLGHDAEYMPDDLRGAGGRASVNAQGTSRVVLAR